MFCAILLFFIRSSSGGRLGWYYMMGVIALFTHLTVNHNVYKNVRVELILLSFLLYMRLVISWGIRIYPYKTFFTNGHREGDGVYLKYEYDKNYDLDKFYRPAFRIN